MSAILAALEAFMVGTIPLNVAIKVAFATLVIMIFGLGSVCGVKSLCVFIPNTSRNLEAILSSKDLLFFREKGKDFSKELSVNGSCICRSSSGLKELGCIILEVQARNAILKIDEGSGSLSFGSLAVVKGSVNSLFEGVKGVHSSVKCCVDVFNFFLNLCGLK